MKDLKRWCLWTVTNIFKILLLFNQYLKCLLQWRNWQGVWGKFHLLGKLNVTTGPHLGYISVLVFFWPVFFLMFSKGCRGGALGCQHRFPFCLILLTDFHKNASFRQNMLNCFNTTFTFGKQTKDSFINRKFQCRRSYYSLSHFRSRFSFGESRGGGSPRRTRNTSRSTVISDTSAGSTPRRGQQGRRCSHVTLDDLWATYAWV